MRTVSSLACVDSKLSACRILSFGVWSKRCQISELICIWAKHLIVFFGLLIVRVPFHFFSASFSCNSFLGIEPCQTSKMEC